MKGTKVPYRYASHHSEKEEVKYTREEKEELWIEQEEEDAAIWIIAVLEEEIKALTLEELQKGRPRVSQDLERETVQSQIKRDEQGPIWQNMQRTEGI